MTDGASIGANGLKGCTPKVARKLTIRDTGPVSCWSVNREGRAGAAALTRARRSKGAKHFTPKRGFFASRPPKPMELLASLTGIFPQFGNQDIVVDVADSPVGIGLHCVMHHFTCYFGADLQKFSARQLTSLGQLLDEAVLVDDQLENAVSTCLLEHLRQISAYRALSPYLSKRAREKTLP